MRIQMDKKRNVVLYLDTELVRKTRELGFNLSKTFENHLKHLINNFQNVYSPNKVGNSVIRSPRFELSSAGPKPAMLNCTRRFSDDLVSARYTDYIPAYNTTYNMLINVFSPPIPLSSSLNDLARSLPSRI